MPQTIQEISTAIASPDDIAKCLKAVYDTYRWDLPYANGKGSRASVLTFYANEGGIVTQLGEHCEEDLRSMAFAVTRSLEEAGFCYREPGPQGYLDVVTGDLSIPARLFKVSTINEVSRAIDIRDTLDLFCKERGFKTAWSISSDLKDGIHLQTSAGQTFIPGNFETRQSSEALGRFIDHLGNESSLYQYGNQELIRTVVRDCIATGLIQKDTDMKLSQDVHRTMYCEEDEIAVALQVPVSKIVSVSGAVGFVERSKLSKPVYDMTVRAIPFIEDFVRGQIQLRTVRNLGSDSVSAPVRANRVNESQRGDTFKVLVQPMTPSIPSVHVDVCFKDKAELAAFEQGVRASRLNVETEESQERGFVGVVRILDCSVPQFKDFLESHIRMSLRSAWSGMDERGELG